VNCVGDVFFFSGLLSCFSSFVLIMVRLLRMVLCIFGAGVTLCLLVYGLCWFRASVIAFCFLLVYVVVGVAKTADDNLLYFHFRMLFFVILEFVGYQLLRK